MKSTLHRTALGLGATLALALTSYADGGTPTTEDFETTANPAGWSFNVTTPDVIEPTGGHPDGHLHNDNVQSFAARLTTNGTDNAFCGDFRAMGVTSISLDAITNAAGFSPVNGFEMSLVLRDTKGTPNDADDDDYAYYVGPNVPLVGEGWKSYTFPIPSSDTSDVPAGWSGGHSGDLEAFRPGVTWSDVIANVDRVEVWWLNPAFFAIFRTWDVGADNVTITKRVAVEDFETAANNGGWSFNVTTPDVLEATGGNPDGYLHNDNVQSFAARLTTNGTSNSFVGDFRARNVSSISLDAITHAAGFSPVNGFEMSLVLRDTKGTPNDADDDDYAYYVGPNVPLVGEGWKSYTFPIPSSDTSDVPAGWSGGHSGDLEAFRPGVTWSDVITNVDRVEVWWLNPAFFAIFRTWDVGADNLAIQTGDTATATVRNGGGLNPLTLSGSAPVLGQTWTATQDCSANGPGIAVLLGHAAPASGTSIPAGELLIDLTSSQIFRLSAAHTGGVVNFSGDLPNDPALCGLSVSVQGVCTGAPGAQLGNALDLVVGF